VENITMKFRVATAVTVAILAVLAAALPAAATGDTLANVRSATAIYNDPTAALAGGYTLLTDATDRRCSGRSSC
jgi:hypothetical protein